jgi:hypothetical protein
MVLLLRGVTIAVVDMAIPEDSPVALISGEAGDGVVMRKLAPALA